VQGGEPPTEPFAIVAFIASLALFFCFLGPIVGIVFGHLARSRMQQNGKRGRGLTLAALIISYSEIVLAIGAVITVLLVLAHTSHDATPTARGLADRIDLIASEQGTTPRDGDAIRLAVREHTEDVLVGDSDEIADDATDAEFAAEAWRLEVHHGFREQACIYLPDRATAPARIEPGGCPFLTGGS
jgi:hypothetical protein